MGIQKDNSRLQVLGLSMFESNWGSDREMEGQLRVINIDGFQGRP